jgi:hypothetical protein
LPSSYRFSAAGFTIVSGDGGETNCKWGELRKGIALEKKDFCKICWVPKNWLQKEIWRGTGCAKFGREGLERGLTHVSAFTAILGESGGF